MFKPRDFRIKKGETANINRTGESPASSAPWALITGTPRGAHNHFRIAGGGTVETGTISMINAPYTVDTAVLLSVYIGAGATPDLIALLAASSAGMVIAPPSSVSSSPRSLSTASAPTPFSAPAPETYVVARAREHRGAPNLPLLGPDGGRGGVFFLRSRQCESNEAFDIAVQVPADDELRFRLSDIGLEQDLRNLELVEERQKEEYRVVPIDIHVCSDTIVLVDRSARMLESTRGPCPKTKWTAAREAVNLFSALSGLSVPDLATRTQALKEPNRLAVVDFFEDGQPNEIGPVLVPASEIPLLPGDPPEAEFKTALGAALEAAARALPKSLLRRRHIVVVTAGMDEDDSASLDQHVRQIKDPRVDPDEGVHVHVIVCGRPGEAEDPRLARLAYERDGLYFHMASTSPSELLTPLLSILQELLPIQMVPAANHEEIVLENGVIRALFSAKPGRVAFDKLQLYNDGFRTRPKGGPSEVRHLFADTNFALAGPWRLREGDVASGLFAVAESPVQLNCQARVDAAGSAAGLTARLTLRGRPISGAEITAVVTRERDAAGPALSKFARSGELAEALRRRATSAERLAAGGDSLRGALLDAWEASKHLPFQREQVAIRLTEAVGHPGVYRGDSPPLHAGVTEVRFHATGETSPEVPLLRSATLSVLVPPIPEKADSFVWFEGHKRPDGANVWHATMIPRSTRLGQPLELGPGLTRMIGLAYKGASPGSYVPTAISDNWDGSYSAEIVTASPRAPAVFATHRHERTGEVLYVPLEEDPGLTRRVVVTLVQVLYRDAEYRAPCPSRATVFTAPNGSFPRSARHTVDLDGVSPGVPFPVNEVVLDTRVEDGASLVLALGDESLDFFRVFEDPSASDYRVVTPSEASFESEPASRGPTWNAWYRVDVISQKKSEMSGPSDLDDADGMKSA